MEQAREAGAHALEAAKKAVGTRPASSPADQASPTYPERPQEGRRHRAGGGGGGSGSWAVGPGEEGEYHDEELSAIEPAYATKTAIHPAPKHELPRRTLPAHVAKSLVDDMLEMDFKPRMNLSTFVNTWMEPEAEELMMKAISYNLADAVQYASAAEMEKRCIDFMAHLWNVPNDDFIGTGCVGSSEACYLGGLAMKKRWQERRRSQGQPADRPNIVLSHVAQVCWQKFCSYFDVEPRYVDVTEGNLVLDPENMCDHIDENTIGIVTMMGSTYTGQFEPVERADAVLQEIKKEKGWEVPMHVDAANAGLVAPLCKPHVIFDFRLPSVGSMNFSAHKYGLTFCGCAFIVWRSRDWVPKDMVFTVDYLGKEESNLTVNFSRPGMQTVGQYYNFIRFGRDGYRRMFENLFSVYDYLVGKLEETGHFDILSTGDMPILAFRLKPLKSVAGMKHKRTYNEYDVMKGLTELRWMVPAYKMAPDASHIHLLRVCLRVGFDCEMAELLVHHMKTVIETLDKHTSSAVSSPGQAYEKEQEELAEEFKQRAGPC